MHLNARICRVLLKSVILTIIICEKYEGLHKPEVSFHLKLSTFGRVPDCLHSTFPPAHELAESYKIENSPNTRVRGHFLLTYFSRGSVSGGLVVTTSLKQPTISILFQLLSIILSQDKSLKTRAVFL